MKCAKSPQHKYKFFSEYMNNPNCLFFTLKVIRSFYVSYTCSIQRHMSKLTEEMTQDHVPPSTGSIGTCLSPW